MRLIDTDEIRIKPEYMHDICGVTMIRVEDIARILNDMPTIQPEPHWIPCSERLPEERKNVLCCFWNGENTKIIVSQRADYNYWSWVGRTGDMIAWMPLPSPYHPKEDES